MAGIGAERPASTSSRNASVCGSSVFSKAHSRELPARRRREEVAVGSTAVPARGGTACALEHELPAHELAVIFADGARGGRKAGEGIERAPGPFPDVAEQAAARKRQDRARMIELVADHGVGRASEILPLGFGRKPRSGPAGEGVGLVIADVSDRSRPVDLAPPAERKFAAVLVPVERRFDPFALDPVPSFAEPQGRRAIAVVAHELAPFLIGDPLASELMEREENAVLRSLGIKREALGSGTDLDHSLA